MCPTQYLGFIYFSWKRRKKNTHKSTAAMIEPVLTGHHWTTKADLWSQEMFKGRYLQVEQPHST